MVDGSPSYDAHFRSIRSAIVAVALAVLTAEIITGNEEIGLLLFLLTLLVALYSFVPTFLHSLRSG